METLIESLIGATLPHGEVTQLILCDYFELRSPDNHQLGCLRTLDWIIRKDEEATIAEKQEAISAFIGEDSIINGRNFVPWCKEKNTRCMIKEESYVARPIPLILIAHNVYTIKDCPDRTCDNGDRTSFPQWVLRQVNLEEVAEC